jgi:hypothetical protein
MSDGAAEWTARRTFGVDVDPLVIVGGVSENVDAVLCDLEPFRRTELAALRRDQLIEPTKGFHCRSFSKDH